MFRREMNVMQTDRSRLTGTFDDFDFHVVRPHDKRNVDPGIRDMRDVLNDVECGRELLARHNWIARISNLRQCGAKIGYREADMVDRRSFRAAGRRLLTQENVNVRE